MRFIHLLLILWIAFTQLSCGIKTNAKVYNNTNSPLSVQLAELKTIAAHGSEEFSLTISSAVYLVIKLENEIVSYNVPPVPDEFTQRGIFTDIFYLQIEPDMSIYLLYPNADKPFKSASSKQPTGFPLVGSKHGRLG